MNKEDFLNNTKDFIDWLVEILPSLKVEFNMKSTAFVPRGNRSNGKGVEWALEQYRWIDDWPTTRKRLNNFSRLLNSSVANGDNKSAQSVCLDIIKWGGDRNSKVGATPFILGKVKRTSLCKYIKDCSLAMSLNVPTLNNFHHVERMNSMLTKIHAIYSCDGLPIYDSRVAASISSLVELYRVNEQTHWVIIPPDLTFPVLTRTRTPMRLNPDALNPGLLVYGGGKKTTQEWVSAKIRLGWIMQAVLAKSTSLFENELDEREMLGASLDQCGPDSTNRIRMHAFEAALFMLGYDPKCLAANLQGQAASVAAQSPLKYGKVIASLCVGLKQHLSRLPIKACKTLDPVRGNEFEYHGDPENGFLVIYAQNSVVIDLGFIEDILLGYSGKIDIPLGVNRNGRDANVPDNSFGLWVADQSERFGQRLTGQHASRIAAILVNEKLATSKKIGRSIFLDFC